MNRIIFGLMLIVSMVFLVSSAFAADINDTQFMLSDVSMQTDEVSLDNDCGVLRSGFTYVGTGFTHNKSISDYVALSENDIISKYIDTNCTGEVTGLCTRVIDGDTIDLDGVGRIRFVGINTPEKGVEGADTSQYFVEKLCLNRDISIDIDDAEPADKYGRTLAVVIVDGKNLNEMLLNEGLAEIMYIPPSEFNPYSWLAYSTHVPGESSTDVPACGDGTCIGNSNTHKFHNPECKYAKQISEKNKVTFPSRDDALSEGYQPCKICNP